MKVLITAALPYANGAIHFGHLAGAYLPADCYARFQRLIGNEVCFICGSDEYGVAITLASELQGRSPKQHVDIFHEINKKLFERLSMSFDHYSRTTSAIHTETTQEFFQNLERKGLVTPRESEQLFCEEDGRFYADRYVVGTCPKCGFQEARGDECTRCGASYDAIDLTQPRTKVGGRPLTHKKTIHWYLRLDLLKQDVLNWIEAKKSWKPNVLRFVQNYVRDLQPRAITRDMSWGVPVPLSEAKGKVLYVWFDAPIGYISATKEWAIEKKKDADKWRDFWLDPSTKLVQFIGKDNIAFHAVIFPAVLMGQDLPYKLVDELPANEFYMLQGKQFSKSEGWYIDLEKFLNDFDPELLRYTIASTAPEAQDAEFTWREFQSRVNADLVGKIGNFIHRTVVFVQNTYSGKVPAEGPLAPTDHDFIAGIYEKMNALHEAFSMFHLRRACQIILEIAQSGNVYFDMKKPWVKEQEAATRETALYLCLDCVKLLSVAISPILPKTAEKVRGLLGISEHNSGLWHEKISWKLPHGHTLMRDPKPLFQKIEDSVIQAEEAKLAPKTPEGVLIHEHQISFDEFKKIKLEVVQIISVESVPKSTKLLKLRVLGKNGERQIISGIAEYYSPEELIGKKVVACVNLKPVRLMGLESNGMILAASTAEDGRIEIIEVRSSPFGASVH